MINVTIYCQMHAARINSKTQNSTQGQQSNEIFYIIRY